MTRRARGRPPQDISKIRIELQLPLDVVSWLNQQTYDTFTGRARYGARADIVERLLREEMARKRNEQTRDANLEFPEVT